LRASVGDWIHVAGTHVSDHERDGEILEVRGENGTPPYVVRWSDTGHEALVFPGPDASIRPADPEAGQPGDTQPPG
jgi:hypothetical protein